MVGLLASLVPRPDGTEAALVMAATGLVLAALDVAGRTPTLRRQTEPGWWLRRGPYGAAFLWGFDLGLGLTTIRVASLYWFVLFGIVILGSPASGALVLSAYGIGLGVNLAFGLLVLDRTRRGQRANIRAIALAPIARTALVAVLVAWSAVFAANALV